MKRILLVEDYEEKANNILAFLKQEFPDCEVKQCTSYNSAQEEIFEHGSDYSLILLDMSMSTYDLSTDASGGLPEPSAGQYILEGMFLREIMTPVIVVTMYNVFGRKQLAVFDGDLKKDYPQNYKSYVYYSSQKNDWKNHLKRQIKEILS
ncbi:response regulator transcription factor [Tannerella forsythia]|nr:response regulator [Tannerella forsythia]